MPIIGSLNSAANKDMMAKVWTNGDTIIRFELKTLWEKEELLVMRHDGKNMDKWGYNYLL